MTKAKNKNMKDFNYKEVQFHRLLKSTQKWKEIFTQKESLISAIVSIGIVLTLAYLFKEIDMNKFNVLLIDILNIAISTIIGLLGFIISGIAIFTGTITNKLVNNIDSDSKAESLIGILFSFYFIGAVIGVTVVGYIFMYLFTYSSIKASVILIIIIGYILSYLYIFSIFYSISLIGTCLKLFFVSYRYSDNKTEKGAVNVDK